MMVNSNIFSVVEAVKKATADAVSVTKLIHKNFYDISSFAKQIASNFEQIQKSIIANIKPFIELSENIARYREIEKEVLKKSGWYICPSLDPIPYHLVAKAVNKYDKNHSSITNLMKKIYGNNDWAYLEQVIDEWGNHRFFTKQRMRIIKDALIAHKNKMYTLTIPSLLPIIEGISYDYCKEQGISVRRSDSSGKARNSISRLTSERPYTSELVLHFIEEQLFTNTDELKNLRNRKYLNRHGILHGQYSGYADCPRSLRCFLFLDVLTLL